MTIGTILKLILLSLLCLRECSKIPTFGKITVKNEISDVIRVVLSPAISWNYYEQRTNLTLSKNPVKSVGGNYIPPGNTQNVYFPLISHESISSSQLQLATVYDTEGNALLLNENVLMNRTYVFKRFSSSLYLLLEPLSSVMNSGTANCLQTCPVGPPGPPGVRGLKGEPGIIFKEPNLQWCNLEMHNIIIQTILSTSKKIVLLKPPERKSFFKAKSVCESICGNLYFPSTLIESLVVRNIARDHGAPDYDIWLRISDAEEEGVWKDPDDKEVLNFTNWSPSQPDNAHGQENYGIYWYAGKWNDGNAVYGVSYIVCELS